MHGSRKPLPSGRFQDSVRQYAPRSLTRDPFPGGILPSPPARAGQAQPGVPPPPFRWPGVNLEL